MALVTISPLPHSTQKRTPNTTTPSDLPFKALASSIDREVGAHAFLELVLELIQPRLGGQLQQHSRMPARGDGGGSGGRVMRMIWKMANLKAITERANGV